MMVAFVCGGYNSIYGGNFIASLLHLDRAIKENGRDTIWVFNNDVVNRTWYKELINYGITVELLDFDKPLFNRVLQFYRLLKKYHIKIIHIHFGDKLAATISACLRFDIGIIWHIHSDWTLGNDKSLFQRIQDLIKSIAKIRIRQIVVNEKLRSNGDIYIPNGIATERIYALSNVNQVELRRELGIAENMFLVLMFAWEPVVKGADVAVEAIKQLRRERIDIELAIVIGEIDNTSMYIKNKCGKCEFIHYLNPIENVFDYYSISNIFLSASRSEGFSYSVCEAIEMEKPCVISDISGCSWAKEYRSPVFFESGNINSCAQAIKCAMERINSENYRNLIIEDARRCREKYNTVKWSKSIIEAYQKFGFWR